MPGRCTFPATMTSEVALPRVAQHETQLWAASGAYPGAASCWPKPSRLSSEVIALAFGAVLRFNVAPRFSKGETRKEAD